MRFFLIAVVMMVTTCRADETVRAYGGADRVWHLVELDGAPFTAPATLTFPEAGRIAGKAPCNQYFGELTVPYPWFDVQNIGTTRMACPDLKSETQFLEALKAMTLSEILADVLILSTPEGREMVFSVVD